MQFISGRPKVIVTVDDIKELVAKHFKVEVDSFDLEISDFYSGNADRWYPDNTGKWIEVDPTSMKMSLDVRGDTPIRVLLKDERDKKDYSDYISDADSYVWSNNPEDGSRIVAYAVV